ncbi:rhamnan synthesis F family protein [Sulfuricurvum sp.]|uniref:rhamnan synthesis F family protein n=1 Tax=Sulfuricurvum sp. TaxID=2025608 RepID=UPI002628A357|nr:rhamnan synthesis F family protein [Sulfuricurvum sp.]MDD2780471.1 rhamnan synthesis F family protein [Sulfuricurvum sp.]
MIKQTPRIRLSSSEKSHIRMINFFDHHDEGDKLCIYSHFDPDGIIDAYVIFALRSMKKMGYAIVFVTTSEKIAYREINKVRRYVKVLVVKKNIGYDFMSWKAGLYAVGDYTKYKQIIHMNDSIFYPLSNPKKMFDSMKKRRLDFWGLADSYNIQYHIQSYFWVFEQKIVKSYFYNLFWNTCRVIENKQKIIDSYELECAKKAIKAGFTVGGFVEFDKLLESVSKKFNDVEKKLFAQVNPAYYLWDTMIEIHDAPFLKKNILLRTHSDYNPESSMWHLFVNQYTYNPSLIERYIERIDKKGTILYFAEEVFNYFLEQIESLKQYNCVVIYGYGQVGRFVHCLTTNIVGAVDGNEKNSNILNRFYGVDIEVKPKESIVNMDYDKIVICSIGYEKEAIKSLDSLGITEEKLILLSQKHKDLIPFVHILRTIIRLHFIELKSEREIYVTSSNDVFITYVRAFLNFIGLYPKFILPDNVRIECPGQLFQFEIFSKHK